MATSMRALTFLRTKHFSVQVNGITKFSSSSRVLNSGSYDPGYGRDPGEVFFKQDVQTLLERLTGRDFEKIFGYRRLGTNLRAPKVELLTDEELAKVMAETESKAKQKLKMPPLLSARSNTTKVLCKNPEMQGFDPAKYVFTDISLGVSDRKRFVVVRDTEGVLREASWEEKQRVSQIFFPVPGRQIRIPKMFDGEHLQNCLSRGDYEFVLDRACAQFDPDDPDYIRVTRKTYDHIDANAHYSHLRSTRHFGPMALHLVLVKRLDGLLCHFISRKEVDAAADLVRLYHSVETASVNQEVDGFLLIEDYIKNHALKKPSLELVWEAFLEMEKQRLESKRVTNQASS